MNVLFCGDTVPTESNYFLFREANLVALVGEALRKKLDEVDHLVLNLETPITDVELPIEKCGPNLMAPTQTINGIKAMNPSLISLANNHIMDQGKSGFESTVSTLDRHGIRFVGAGFTLSEASKPVYLESKGKRIGIYSCAEHEFSIVTKSSPGANPFDALESFDHISIMSKQCDYAVVLYHGGKEHFRYPSPYLQKLCRKMVDKGADVVLCQHSHCIGCEEKWKSGTIVYGQGNFIFDRSESEYWQTSLLVEITLDKDIKIEYIPIVKKGASIRLANSQEKSEILSAFKIRTNEIKEEGFVEANYVKFAEKMLSEYLLSLQGRLLGKYIIIALRKILKRNVFQRMVLKLYAKRHYYRIKNYIECEAHRELFIAGINNVLGFYI